MDQVTTIHRGETTYAEENWRYSGSGRVVTYDLTLEMPQSQRIAGLGRNSAVVFEDRQYKVNHREPVGSGSREVVRLVLSYAPEPQRANNRR